MQLTKKNVMIVVLYWYILAFMSGWIANDSAPIEIFGLIALDLWGFIATIYVFKTKSPKTEESEK